MRARVIASDFFPSASPLPSLLPSRSYSLSSLLRYLLSPYARRISHFPPSRSSFHLAPTLLPPPPRPRLLPSRRASRFPFLQRLRYRVFFIELLIKTESPFRLPSALLRCRVTARFLFSFRRVTLLLRDDPPAVRLERDGRVNERARVRRSRAAYACRARPPILCTRARARVQMSSL